MLEGVVKLRKIYINLFNSHSFSNEDQKCLTKKQTLGISSLENLMSGVWGRKHERNSDKWLVSTMSLQMGKGEFGFALAGGIGDLV